MSGFTYQGGDLDRVYMTTSGLFDSFVGEQLWTCGYNSKGELGSGTTAARSSLGTVAGGGTTWATVAAGPSLTAAIKTDGTLWTCGINTYGELGTGNNTSISSFVTVAGGGTTWQRVTAGGQHMAAIKTDGTLWTWGSGDSGGLGNNSTANTNSPGTVAGGGTTWQQVATGPSHTCAVKTDGTLWTWGANFLGSLGNGTTANRSSPGTVAGGGTTWLQVSGSAYTTAAIKTDGTLWTWGYNNKGELGNGTTTNRSSPGTTSGGGTTWRQVSCGYQTLSAIKTDGTLWTCGYNANGQLGTGTTTNRSSLATVAGGGTTWKQVEAATQYGASAAIKTDSTLWTWGRGAQGTLGNGSTANTSSPGTVSGINTTWKQVSVGTQHTVAIG